MTPPNPFAELTWNEAGQPFSTEFGDVYFSQESGLEESRYVFLKHNALPERWAALRPGAHFCIGETGFGTGLNFLCAWQLWDQTAPADAHLHFVSTEKHPLSAADMQRALALWPELQPWATQLASQYADLAPGWQHFVLAHGRVTLTLLIGDLLETLPELDANVDAWFLDGFAPARNPQMWQPALYQQMARLSAPGATLATFTSVGEVKRGLRAAGFKAGRVKGYGCKRHMLTGALESRAEQPWAAPWYARPPNRLQAGRSAIIVGAGLAGCCTAWSLANRGWRVTLIERHASEAQEASGNPQGILYCKLSPHQTPLSRFVQASYSHALRLLHQVLPQGPSNWEACGVLQLATSPKEQSRLDGLGQHGYPPGFLHSLSQAQASESAGLAVPTGGLFFPQGGWVNPPALCRALLAHPLITLQNHHEVFTLERDGAIWSAKDGEGAVISEATVAVICSAADSLHLAPTAHLPLKAIRGQITHLPATEDSRKLLTVLCAEGYISPARHGEHHLGASFRFDRLDTEPSAEENESNIGLLDSLAPGLIDALDIPSLDIHKLKARAAMRCTTPDYLPAVGPLVDPAGFRKRYAVLGKDASKRPTEPAPWHQGLYVNAAHGSRGLISAPLSGELVAAWIENEPLPLPRPLAEAVHPSRFLLRALIRGSGQKS